jgi:hypothetical protein
MLQPNCPRGWSAANRKPIAGVQALKVAASVDSSAQKTPYPFGYGAGYWWPTRPTSSTSSAIRRTGETLLLSIFLDSPYGEMVYKDSVFAETRCWGEGWRPVDRPKAILFAAFWSSPASGHRSRRTTARPLHLITPPPCPGSARASSTHDWAFPISTLQTEAPARGA